MIEYIPYRGWSKCCRLSNSAVEIIATLEVGPRLLRLGLVGGENLLKEFDVDMGQTGGDQFRFYGGHRFWHSPEHPVRTYYPDNSPVQCQEIESGVRLTQAAEPTTGLQKELEIKLMGDAAQAQVLHRMTNQGLWPVRFAPWALSMMTTGGTAIVPLPPRGSHTAQLLPTSSLTLWAYTDLSDPRWTWGRDHILLRQDIAHPAPQKLGGLVPDGWLAYALHDVLFIKRFTCQADAQYPDLGCCAEIFTNGEFLELETLGPLVELEPGASVEHIEQWQLHHDPRLLPAAQTDALWPIVQSHAQHA